MGLVDKKKRKVCETPIPFFFCTKREEGKKEGRTILLTWRGDMSIFLWGRIKDDLFVSSLIRNIGLRKQRERGEQTRTLVYFSRGGRGEKARGYQNIIISSALDSLLLLSKQQDGSWFWLSLKYPKNPWFCKKLIDSISSIQDCSRWPSEEKWSLCGHRMRVYACTWKEPCR